MHHQASPFLSEHAPEAITSVLVDQISEIWLSTKFVHSLRDLVTSSIAETGEERDEFLGDGCVGGTFEDDGLDVSGELTSVRHESLSDSVL